MDDAEIEQRLRFLQSAEGLKRALRSAHLSDGRAESVAEHSWRLGLWVIVFRDHLEDVDLARVLELLVVHDLGEAISGDIPAILELDPTEKAEQERRDLDVLLSPLRDAIRDNIWALWEEYEAGVTLEAQWAKGLDKLETMLQHNQGQNPDDFDYLFNLTYGLHQTDKIGLLSQIRVLIDADTAANAGR